MLPPSTTTSKITTPDAAKLERGAVLPPRVAAWCRKHAHKIASHNGLPGPFHRAYIFRSIRPRDTVAIETRHGQVILGQVVMVFSSHAVLNLGGAHGTPGIANENNTVYASGFSFKYFK